jgi:hypothetical protein
LPGVTPYGSTSAQDWDVVVDMAVGSTELAAPGRGGNASDSRTKAT